MQALHPECASNILTNVCYTSGSVQSQIYTMLQLFCADTLHNENPHTLDVVAKALGHPIPWMIWPKSLDVIGVANLLLPVCGVITHSLLGNLDWLLIILHV